jgi:simple sugar transport system permease protein
MLRLPSLPERTRIGTFLKKRSSFLGALSFYIVLMLVFITWEPQVFTSWQAYTAVFVSLPILIMLAMSLVFVVVAGEIDLSFGSLIGISAWTFASCAQAGWGPLGSLAACVLVGMAAGALNGILVARLGLSSLVLTLGMLFLWRGAINIRQEGRGIDVTPVVGGWFGKLVVGTIGGFPVQMIWAAGFAAILILIFNRHRFGANICCVGDNRLAAREMGISVARVKIGAFVLVGLASALAGVIAVLVNSTFYPTTGDGYLLPAIAAVFVGGTPTWGGVGTIAGAVVGAFTIGFIDSGLIGVGLSGYYTQFFYGLVIILSLLGHWALRGRR